MQTRRWLLNGGRTVAHRLGAALNGSLVLRRKKRDGAAGLR